MTSNNRWLLPDGIDELLPERAATVEALRRSLLDTCASWGYQYVIPPLVEFTDSLLVGLGADLDVLTCKFTDQLSGRTLGVRADITPQVARIDAHSMPHDAVTRLCYTGSTLHSTAQSVMSGRSPIQLGAECFGCADLDADLEVIELMLSLLGAAPLLLSQHRALTFDIGHIGVYQALMADAALGEDVEQAVFDALQRKSAPDLAEALSRCTADAAASIQSLADLHGGVDVLPQARELLSRSPAALAALDQVDSVVARVSKQFPGLAIYVDLAELRGFRYHTGLVFAAYLSGIGAAVAKGGRYDNVGAVFGRSRPATGFAIDVKALAAAVDGATSSGQVVLAPSAGDEALSQAIDQLRGEGHTVLRELAGNADSRCSHRLVRQNEAWVVLPLDGVES
ncbi:ATP phosphoribosyltransferase, regulatory subunit [Luminiphilus syltensis NOR5-1B]|uniref:ATP phosphoribosyltransferase regulatory subunit n=1 Tax=Luminiphilus syltensis NOR5-1B TaxID=565045 RepID=B8KW68_9GAMM|nr:ATP phosphoribosyltransferase regulatory subunit [Luminiphilus syltensis]EED35947.1 ATP phosphoribosyltransferase, regulatory subunit [Luminiphilus syltensis NOR5-1B]